jgi:thiol-disulfide isomerase/thioredoxin
VRLSDYQNKVVILDFYATWCGPCRMSIPNLVQLQKQYGAQGLQVVGLNVDAPDDLEKVPAFARSLHIQYQLGTPDPDLERLYRGNDDSIPLTVVLDRQGKQVYRVPGYGGAATDQEVEDAVQKSLAAKGPLPGGQ